MPSVSNVFFFPKWWTEKRDAAIKKSLEVKLEVWILHFIFINQVLKMKKWDKDKTIILYEGPQRGQTLTDTVSALRYAERENTNCKLLTFCLEGITMTTPTCSDHLSPCYPDRRMYYLPCIAMVCYYSTDHCTSNQIKYFPEIAWSARFKSFNLQYDISFVTIYLMRDDRWYWFWIWFFHTGWTIRDLYPDSQNFSSWQM